MINNKNVIVFLLFITVLPSCKMYLLGRYNSKEIESAGEVSSILIGKDTFFVNAHLCESSKGTITILSPKVLQLKTIFQKDSIQMLFRNKLTNRPNIIFNGFPICAFENKSSRLQFYSECMVDSVIMVLGEQSFEIHDTSILLPNLSYPYPLSVKIHLRNSFFCGYQTYTFTHDSIMSNYDYLIDFKDIKLSLLSFTDTFLVKRNQLISKDNDIFLLDKCRPINIIPRSKHSTRM